MGAPGNDGLLTVTFTTPRLWRNRNDACQGILSFVFFNVLFLNTIHDVFDIHWNKLCSILNIEHIIVISRFVEGVNSEYIHNKLLIPK